MRRLAVIVLLLAAATRPAAAQIAPADVVRAPTEDLYIKRRPPVPEAPDLTRDLEALLKVKEKKRDAKRAEAIKLLRGFLATKPTGEGRAEGLFKLADLLWEDARFKYIDARKVYDRKLEACRVKSCKAQPDEPQLDLREPEALFRDIIENHPEFRRMDLALYLVGFAARERGANQEALTYFQRVIDEHKESPLYGDAWMMVGEYYFQALKWDYARAAYLNVLERPDHPTYDLALFKTAWCEWRLGNLKEAANRFGQVLEKAKEAEKSGDAKKIKQSKLIRDEAFEYLVILFTEDQSMSAKDIYAFLISFASQDFSYDVLVRVAESYYNQNETDRAVDAFNFLISLQPDSLKAATHMRRIVDAYRNEPDKAIEQVKKMVAAYGPKSEWAKANRDSPALKRSLAATDKLAMEIAKNLHADAQDEEKASAGKRPPPPKECPDNPPRNLAMYELAARAYDAYLDGFPDGANAQEVRFLRADILFFKMGKHEPAGDEYLAVGKTSPLGKFHKDALLQAMRAFECARPRNVTGKRELLPVDRKFAAAVDLFATLFQGDDTLVGVVFRNGQLFYDYGDYGEAVKRFGLIVTKYPNHPDAGPAGDRILNALIKSQDFETVEEWARKLKKAKAFDTPEKQADLDRMIVESIVNSGKKYGDAGKHEQAAKFYLRVAKEYRDHELAAPSLFEAAVQFRKGKRPETAGATYLAVVDTYPKHKLAAEAAFEAGQVYEQMAYYDRAAEAYEVVVAKYLDRDKVRGADALYNAGLLRQALGQNPKAIAHFEMYSKKLHGKDAAEVAFRIGMVHEQAKDDGRAERAYRDYMKRFRPDGARNIEAHTRAGRAALVLGQLKRASEDFDIALKLYKKVDGKEKAAATRWAAEARYHQGELVHREYQKIGLDVKMNKLKATLEKKKELLAKAKGIYEEVVGFGDLQWAAAALYRRGAIFEEFAKAMRDAPDPPGVSDDVIELYRNALEDQIVKIEKIAVERYEEGYRKVIELKIYNKHTRMMREALGRLASSEYPPSNEERSRVRVGDLPPQPKLVEEVIRE